MKNLKALLAIIFLVALVIALNACSSSDEIVAKAPAFDITNLPMTLDDADGIGSFVFDNNGNLLFVAQGAAELRSLSRETSTVSVIATGLAGYDLRGIAVTTDYIYLGGASGQIYRVDPSTGASSLFATIAGGGYINCLAIAPSSFGSYGGQIIAATSAGIYAVNISTLATVQITSASFISSIVFGSDGTLYAARYTSNEIATVTSTGTVTAFVSTELSGPDGLTIDDANGYLYVTNDGDGMIKRVRISDGTVLDVIVSLPFNSGWAPTPIILDTAGNRLLVGYGTGELTITCILM